MSLHQAPLLPPTDVARLRDLRRMKLVASGFLLAAVVVYLVATAAERAGAPAWVGFVAAAAEAGMVGALADWFAVTALFRRPLGLPIPHTAIVPRKKDTIAVGLADFVQTNFVSEDAVADRVRRADLVGRGARWLCEPEHAERVAAEGAALAASLVTSVRDEDVTALVRSTVLSHVAAMDLADPLGNLITATVTDGAHARLVTLAFDRLATWLRDNRGRVVAVVAAQGPVSQRGPVRWVHEQVAERIHHDLLRFVTAVRDDETHAARAAIDDWLLRAAADLHTDRAVRDRLDRAKRELLAQPETHRALADLWPTTKRLLLEALQDPASDLRRRMREEVAGFGRRLGSDEAFRATAEERLDAGVRFLVRRYGVEVARMITETVQRWDATDTSRRIELHVGRDLQYIRINGTVVGALAGLVIHAVTVAVF